MDAPTPVLGDAWDPDEPGVETVLVADIARRPDWQVRARTDPATVKSYRDAYSRGARFPPVEVARIGGTLALVDGWHRLEAQAGLGWPRIAARVVVMDEADARWRAAVANLGHGQPLKKADLRRVFGAYVGSGQHRHGRRLKSYREMEADMGGRVAHTTLRNWTREDFPAVFAKLGGGGRDEPAEAGAGPGWEAAAPMTPEERTMAALQSAVAEARSIPDPAARAKLAEACRGAAEAIAAGAPWKAPGDDDGSEAAF